MDITNFDDLLRAAREQPQPQRLLFVFMGAELPDASTPDQRAAFAAGHSGALAPLMCVDKAPESLTGFAALLDESRAAGPDWALVFAAALAGAGGRPPSPVEVESALQRMVDLVKTGSHANFIPFNRDGRAVRLA